MAISLAGHGGVLMCVGSHSAWVEGSHPAYGREPLVASLRPQATSVFETGSDELQVPLGFSKFDRPQVRSVSPSPVVVRDGAGVADSVVAPEPFAKTHYPSSELDALPIPMYVPPLDSADMRGLTQEESVEALVFVEADGVVSDVQVVAGSTLFADSVKRGLLGAIFWPGLKNGRAVPSTVSMQVGFPEVENRSLAPHVSR